MAPIAKVEPISVSMRNRRLQWFGHVYCREDDEDIRRVADLKIAGRRKTRKAKAEVERHHQL